MKFYEVVRHNRRLKSEQTPFYRGGKIGKISFFIAVPKFAKTPFMEVSKLSKSLFYSGAKTAKFSGLIGIPRRLVSLFCIRFFQVVLTKRNEVF